MRLAPGEASGRKVILIRKCGLLLKKHQIGSVWGPRVERPSVLLTDRGVVL